MDLGATTDRDLCKQAQDIALRELAPAYNSIYSKLNSLLEVKVTEVNRLSATLTMAELILAIAIIVIIVISLTLSTRIGRQIADFTKNLKTMVEDQTEAMRQAEKGINQISEVVQSNAATAEEASATSEELSAQASILDSLIGQFSLKN